MFKTEIISKFTTPVRSIHLNRKNNCNNEENNSQINMSCSKNQYKNS